MSIQTSEVSQDVAAEDVIRAVLRWSVRDGVDRRELVRRVAEATAHEAWRSPDSPTDEHEQRRRVELGRFATQTLEERAWVSN